MPNWCDNEVTISGSAEKMKPLIELVKKLQEEGKDHKVLFMENVLQVEKPDNYEQGGWYEFNRNTFGTKWDFDIADWFGFEISDTEFSFGVATANSPIEAFVENVCKKYEVNGHIEYFEPGVDFGGYADFNKHGIVSEATYDSCMYAHYILNNGFYEEIESWLDGSDYLSGTLEEFIDEVCPFVKDDEKAMKKIEEMFNDFKE